jgi:hypothetical protein
METSTAIITTLGVIALAAGFYKLILNLERDERSPSESNAVNPTRIEFDSPVANERIQWAMTSTISEAVSIPVETVEDHQDYLPNGLDEYVTPRYDEQVTVDAYENHLSKIGPVNEGIGTILARDADDDWWPIRYRPGHDALGFERMWLYQANGPGGKFCWHITGEERPRGKPITITSWGTIGTMEEIREIVSQRAA